MSQTLLQDQYFMKGKSRHLFWVVMGFFVLMVIAQLLQNSLVPVFMRTFRTDGFGAAYGILCAVILAVYFLGGVILYTAYGMKNSIKAFKVLFFVLAASRIFGAASMAMSDLVMLDRITGALGEISQSRWANASISVFLTIQAVIWTVCMLVAAFHKASGTVLRVSALVLAAYELFYILFVLFLSRQITLYLIRSQQIQLLTTINMVVNLLIQFGFLAASGFFFGAMSFGKQRKPKVPQAAVSA